MTTVTGALTWRLCPAIALSAHQRRWRAVRVGAWLRPATVAAVLATNGACSSAGPARTTSSPPARPSNALTVGAAQIDITPSQPIRLTGYGSRSAPSERVAGRLRAKALAFGSPRERPSVLLTVDLIGVPQYITEEVGRRLEKARIDRSHLAIAATHTHTGPSLSRVLPLIFKTPLTPGEQLVVDRYSAELVDKLETVARAALAARRPARVEWGRGTASFAANRRVLKAGKWVAFGVTPDGAVDRDLPILAVRSGDGTLRAVLVSYACHATTLEGKDNFVHGDWPAAAQGLIEERHPGAIAMVAIGTGADANPNPRGGGLPDVERHGREVADEVDRLLARALRPIQAPPVGRSQSIALPLASTPPASVPYPIQTWTFGDDLAMVFLGGEVVADYGLRLKRELDPSRLWVNAYSNDVAFYVASKRMISEGGYEVTGSMAYYGQPARLGDATEDLIVRTVLDLLPTRFRTRAGS